MKISKRGLMWKFHERWFEMDRYTGIREVDVCGYFWLSVWRVLLPIVLGVLVYGFLWCSGDILLGILGLELTFLTDNLLLLMLLIPLIGCVYWSLFSLMVYLLTEYACDYVVTCIEYLAIATSKLYKKVHSKLCFKVTLED